MTLIIILRRKVTPSEFARKWVSLRVAPRGVLGLEAGSPGFGGIPPGAQGVLVVGLERVAEVGELVLEPRECLEDGGAVLAEDAGPEGGVGAGDPGAVAVGAAGERERLDRDRGRQRRGHGVRQVAGQRQRL